MTRRICIVSHIFGNQKDEFKSGCPTQSKTNTCVVNISFTQNTEANEAIIMMEYWNILAMEDLRNDAYSLHTDLNSIKRDM